MYVGATLLKKGDPQTPSQNFCIFLRIAQAALARHAMIGTTGAACAIRKRQQQGLTEGLGTAFPQKGVPNIIRQNGHAPHMGGRLAGSGGGVIH
jgi:hypothetical protein